MDVISYALTKKIAAHAVSGINSMSVSGQTLIINTKDSGVLTMTFPTPKDGVSVTDIDINANNQIVFTMSDGSEFISGKIPTVKGDKGDPGFSPIITENADNTDKIYKLDITTADSTFTTPNLKGADGQGGSGGSGEENVIDSISVNGTPISIDEHKNVDITVPTVTNDLTDELKSSYDDAVAAKHTHDNKNVLDGITAEKVEIWDKAEENIQSDWNETDDTTDAFIKNKPIIPSLSGYATETWVNEQGFLTQHQDLSNYATKDEIPTVPSIVSELTNDSNYQTAKQVNSTVTTEIAKVVADAPEDFNTLKEMSDWIAGHENDASAMNSAISDNKIAITALQTDKANKSEIPTTLPADGGNADTVNNHTVETDVPTNAVFTDTTYSEATQDAAGLMSTEDKKKLDGITSGAEVNQNAFSNVIVGSTTISADSKTDSLILAGSNVTITPDATNDKVTIGITKANVTSALGYTPPTTNTWRGIQNNLTSDSTTDSLSAAQGKVLKDLVDGKAAASHTHKEATTSSAGLMSAADKTRLNNLFKLTTYTATKTNLDSLGDYTFKIPHTVPSGYTTAGIVSFNLGHTQLSLIRLEYDTKSVYMQVHNTHSTAISSSFTVKCIVLYIRKGI